MSKCLALSIVCLVAGVALVAAPVKILVNDREIKADQSARVISGKVYLPVRATAEAVGGDVEWQAKAKQAVICRGKHCLPITVGRGRDQGRLFGGRVFLPLRHLAQGLGLKVKWDPKLRIVSITRPPAAKPIPGIAGPGS